MEETYAVWLTKAELVAVMFAMDTARGDVPGAFPYAGIEDAPDSHITADEQIQAAYHNANEE